MKRKDIINLIIKELEENLDQKYFDVTYSYVADSILEKLEDEGMSPPWDDIREWNCE